MQKQIGFLDRRAIRLELNISHGNLTGKQHEQGNDPQTDPDEKISGFRLAGNSGLSSFHKWFLPELPRKVARHMPGSQACICKELQGGLSCCVGCVPRPPRLKFHAAEELSEAATGPATHESCVKAF